MKAKSRCLRPVLEIIFSAFTKLCKEIQSPRFERVLLLLKLTNLHITAAADFLRVTHAHMAVRLNL